MATPTWPTFPGHDGAPEVEVIGGSTRMFQSEAGTSWPISLWTSGKLRFTFTYSGLRTGKAAPAPYAAYSEAAAVVYLIGELKGSAGLVNVVNPLTGATVLCRLDSDSVQLKKAPKAPWYQATVSFTQV